MSIQFNDTSTYKGLIQLCERNMGHPRTFISGDSDRLKDWTADINIGMDAVWAIIFEVSNAANPDDVNHTHYPIQFFNLVSGQADYSFTADEDGNLITDIEKVAVKGPDGIFREVYLVDQQTRNSNNVNVDSIIDGQNRSGTPIRYDKTATGLFFDPVPNYNSTNGVKIWIKREPDYFTTADTTQKPGFAPEFHEYPALHATYRNMRGGTYKNREVIKRDLDEMEQAIRRHYGFMNKDIVRRLVPNQQNNK